MSADAFSSVPLAPEDAIFALTNGYKADKDESKINLGVGAYRDGSGKPWVLPVVKKAAKQLDDLPDLDHEYLPIAGLPEFVKPAAKLLFGEESLALKEGRISSTQTISGTGANHLGALFLAKFYPFPSAQKKIYISNPTWANHPAIFKNVGIEPMLYRYYNKESVGLDFEGFKEDLGEAEEGSVFLIHACAHNPTGVDPTLDQWKELIDVILAKKHFVFLDSAYQGFASGDLDKDAQALRLMERLGVPFLACQSFAKNAGLYGERVGALHVVGATEESTQRIKSQIAILQRSEISSPPAWGARVMSIILNSPELFEQWRQEIKIMSGRVIEMRAILRKELESLGTPGSWKHITEQIGMFSFTGLNPHQTKSLVENHHVYLTTNGRISMAGLNESNIQRFAKAVDSVVRADSSKL